MSFYPAKIDGRFRAPKNVGATLEVNAVGTNATFICGAVLRFTLQIDRSTKEIREAKFKTNGCGYVIASADVLAGKIIGKRLTELHSLDEPILESWIETELEKFPERRNHCVELTTKTLRSALADFRARQIEEFTGEKALICTCFGVSEETIENLIVEKSLETTEEVTDACSAGGGCGSCQPLIQEILDAAWRERI